MTLVESPFSLKEYERLVSELTARGYSIASFHNAEPTHSHLILRHDVDMSLEAAVAMARLEKSIGVSSTYFVLLRTEFYNIFSSQGGEALCIIQEMGHEIGLHFDAAYYEDEDTNFAKMVAQESDILEVMTANKVRSFSLHRPHPKMLTDELVVPNRINAYSKNFFQEMAYCSDSRGAWHHGHPLEHPAVKEGRALQLLTHPIWWTIESGNDVREKLDRFLLRRFDFLRAELASNCSAYPQAFKSLGRKEK